MEEYLISKLKRGQRKVSAKRAEQIKYSYQIEENQFILDNYFYRFKNKSGNRNYIIPPNIINRQSMKNYDRTDEDYFKFK
jgi:hypothetical protein